MELDKPQMCYREKVAWLSLIAIGVTFGPYFVLIATRIMPPAPMPNLPMLGLLGGILFVQMLLMIGGRIYLAIHAPEEAKAPADERDREIMFRSMSAAYYLLIGGMCLVGVMMPFSTGGWTIVNAALFSIVAAELLHYAMIVESYRRQA